MVEHLLPTRIALGIVTAAALSLAPPFVVQAQRGGQGPPPAPPAPRAAAPFDPTGYWESLIVDEWRFRVTPQKGDIPWLPLNARAREEANAWDPAQDEANGKACRAYGAVGVMQRPGRLHITWDNDTTLRIDTDAGTQTRLLRFGPAPAAPGEPSWQGYSAAQSQVPPAGPPGAPVSAGPRAGALRVVTTNMRPGYIRKNGVPHSGNAVLTEHFNYLTGAEGEIYLLLTAIVDDPTYLNQPFVRSYTFKKQADASGWDPTPCWPR